MRSRIIVFLLAAAAPLCAQQIIVHDPVMIKQHDKYYVFCTGTGITVYSSADMKQWTREKPVFDAPPAWAVEAIPSFKGHIWAPDVSFHDGLYYLYYSVSAFGKNTSCIGLATNPTLVSSDPKFKWTDHGKVIESIPGRDLWNAIDPNLTVADGNAWLAFGSFWAGIKMVKLVPSLDKIAEPQEWLTLAKRPRDFKDNDTDPAEGAIEAPFIFQKDGWYYLFTSFDFCCRGAESTYKIMVGRSRDVKGPYVDRNDVRLDQGGGSIVIQGNKAWPGVGHNSAYTFDGVDYLIFHGYDMSDGGKPKLLIRKLTWDSQKWPLASLDDK